VICDKADCDLLRGEKTACVVHALLPDREVGKVLEMLYPHSSAAGQLKS
jgi:hypothetical protein